MSDEEESQKQLSLRWETKHHWPDLRREFGVTKTGAAMILSLVIANEWLQYSRGLRNRTRRDEIWASEPWRMASLRGRCSTSVLNRFRNVVTYGEREKMGRWGE
jgi:hypothetical protein